MGKTCKSTLESGFYVEMLFALKAETVISRREFSFSQCFL